MKSEDFISFDFAPPSLRRDIGILGLLHERILGLSHPVFQTLFPLLRDVGKDGLLAGHDK